MTATLGKDQVNFVSVARGRLIEPLWRIIAPDVTGVKLSQFPYSAG